MSNITIPAEAMPTGLLSCEFRRPTYLDRREAAGKFPGARTNPGYTLEQLFFAYCLEKIQGNELPKNPMDYLSRLEGWPLEDTQFAIDVFLEMFTLTKEGGTAAKDYGLRLKKTLSSSYTIPSVDLPGKGPSVTFKAPLLQDAVSSNRSLPTEEVAFTSEELLLANCITHIDNKPVDRKGDPIEVLDQIWHEDVQFLLGVFFSMFTLDRPKREAARSLAKSLREGKPETSGEKVAKSGTEKSLESTK